MAVRYEGEGDEPDLELVDAINTFDLNTPGKGYHGKLSTLLEWNKFDPVDSFEIHRNNVVYSYQKNRNPFIDHPEYVESIWSVATSTEIFNESQISVYLNPVSDYLNTITNETAQGTIYSMNGETIIQFEVRGNFRLSTDNLKRGLYILQLTSQKEVFRTKFIVQ